MLRACVRVLRPGGVTAFYVIAPSPGLSAEELAFVTEAGPTDGDAGPGYGVLLDEAGFVDVEVTDITPEYRSTLQSWIEAYDDEADELRPLIGHEEFAEREARRIAARGAIDDGLLRRYFVRAVTESGTGRADRE